MHNNYSMNPHFAAIKCRPVSLKKSTANSLPAYSLCSDVKILARLSFSSRGKSPNPLARRNTSHRFSNRTNLRRKIYACRFFSSDIARTFRITASSSFITKSAEYTIPLKQNDGRRECVSRHLTHRYRCTKILSSAFSSTMFRRYLPHLWNLVQPHFLH